MHIVDLGDISTPPPSTQKDLEKAMKNIENRTRSNLEKSIEAVAAMSRATSGSAVASTSTGGNTGASAVGLKVITNKISEKQGQYTHSFHVSNRLY